MMSREDKKTFLDQLQLLDEPTKKKVLITTTVMAVALVMYVWLGYFNNIIAGISQDAIASGPSAPAASSPGPTFWENMSGGTAYVYREIAGGLESIGSIFQSPRHYDVTPSE